MSNVVEKVKNKRHFKNLKVAIIVFFSIIGLVFFAAVGIYLLNPPPNLGPNEPGLRKIVTPEMREGYAQNIPSDLREKIEREIPDKGTSIKIIYVSDDEKAADLSYHLGSYLRVFMYNHVSTDVTTSGLSPGVNISKKWLGVVIEIGPQP